MAKYDKMIEATRSKSKRKVEFLKNTVDDMIKKIFLSHHILLVSLQDYLKLLSIKTKKPLAILKNIVLMNDLTVGNVLLKTVMLIAPVKEVIRN